MANRVVSVLGSMLSWAQKAGLVPDGLNPAAKVEKNPERGRERYLTTAEIERLGTALRDAETIGIPWVVDAAHPKAKHIPKNVVRRTVLSPHAVAAVRLLLLLGARLGEVLNLRWKEIDFERGLLLLPDSKTGKKTIILNAPALAVLEGIPRIGEFVIAGRAPREGQRSGRGATSRRRGLRSAGTLDLTHFDYTTSDTRSPLSAPARVSAYRLSGSSSAIPTPVRRTVTPISTRIRFAAPRTRSAQRSPRRSTARRTTMWSRSRSASDRAANSLTDRGDRPASRQAKLHPRFPRAHPGAR